MSRVLGEEAARDQAKWDAEIESDFFAWWLWQCASGGDEGSCRRRQVPLRETNVHRSLTVTALKPHSEPRALASDLQG
jgi:hypothetical protein